MAKRCTLVHELFQSTLSVRRATLGLFCGQPWLPISIHALRKESDLGLTGTNAQTLDFNPRSP